MTTARNTSEPHILTYSHTSLLMHFPATTSNEPPPSIDCPINCPCLSSPLDPIEEPHLFECLMVVGRGGSEEEQCVPPRPNRFDTWLEKNPSRITFFLSDI